MSVRLTIEGIQEAQQANLREIAALRPSGVLGEAIRRATLAAHDYAVKITHVDTGTLKASHRVHLRGLEGVISIDPAAVNPRSRKRPAEYGVYEHARGGSHAFYARTVVEAGPRIASQALALLRRGLP